MKRMLARLAGGYAGMGALAFLMHRARYLSSSQVRDFTDRRSHELLEELDRLRGELRLAQRQLRAANQKAPLHGRGADERAAVAA
jgi:hypothetical protein